ncbi:hypothetical protein GE09DRAFT_1115217 [Coniochaeta sp. 2T2.1]|nr:hypothetical protein GE09DRAFT_1115217 [Coniochaeta sp. 2T2.1]
MPILASLLSSLIGGKPTSTPTPDPNAPIQAPPAPAPAPPRRPRAPTTPQVQQTPPQEPLEQEPQGPHSIFTSRSAKQLSLFAAGAVFLGLTTAVTRRSVARKIHAALPKFYQPSYLGEGAKVESAEGALFAAEALGLATLNTFSFGIMAAGGFSWAFDISSIDDLRARASKHKRGIQGTKDGEAEDTIEDWMASVLGKDGEEDGEGKDERDAKEWMARLLVGAKAKAEAKKDGKE